MKVAIIGAGFGGLSAGYYLAKHGVDVTIFESDGMPGGLAVGFAQKMWNWSMEKHYHHWFSSDLAITNLAKEIGHNVIFKETKTSTFIRGKCYQLDSPFSLLTFPELSLVDRLRTGAMLGYLRYSSKWKDLEKVSASDFLTKYMGKKSWEILWKPLFEKKFGAYANEVPASWFWARIKKRSKNLSYPEGGFLALAIRLDRRIRKLKGKIYYKTRVQKIVKGQKSFSVVTDRGTVIFDRVISTLPSSLFVKLVPSFSEEYKNSLLNLKGVGAVNLVLSLNKQFLVDGTYWLNISDVRFPFLAVVEHTNFMDKKFYNDEYLLYVGNYLLHEHQYFKKEAVDLIREFYPFLKTINPKFNNDWINSAHLFKAPFAQPIISLNYSKMVPDFKTPIEGLYLCNIQQVYPWDRGTNYAVENGEKVAELVVSNI